MPDFVLRSRTAGRSVAAALRESYDAPTYKAGYKAGLIAGGGRSRSLKFSVCPMLRGLRQASSNWLGRIIMAAVVLFLIISFGIWGIGDIFRGFGVFTVAKIGRTEISIDQFRQQYNERLQRISQQLGRPISSDQARALGIEQQILSQMVAEAALDERARQLGLNISNDDVAKRITDDPAFRGINGQFDPSRFQQLVRQAGFYRAALRQRAAPADAAPPARDRNRRRIQPAQDRGRGDQPLPERGAQHRLCRARRQQAGRRPDGHAGAARRLFRYA